MKTNLPKQNLLLNLRYVKKSSTQPSFFRTWISILFKTGSKAISNGWLPRSLHPVKHIVKGVPFLIALGCLLIGIMMLTPVKSRAQGVKTFIVNNLSDSSDLDAGQIGDDGRCDIDPAKPGDQCSLRAAIENHNGNRNVGQNTIVFNIPNAPGSGSIIIRIGSSGNGPLPPVLGSVVIQALNGPDNRRIEIDGTQAGGNAIGLQLLGGDCNISFFIINNFSSHGIFIGGTPPPGGGGHILQSMYIGTNETGTVAKPNGGDGILIFNTPNNTVGGTGLLGNVIAGNDGYGIHITGNDQIMLRPGEAKNNKLIGNEIGQNFQEQNFLPNKQGGILNEEAPNNNIGGSNQKEGNKIVGTKTGITLTGSLTKGLNIEGNYIGRDGTGGKFTAGIATRCGEQLSIKGNFLANIDSVGMDLYLNASGGYNVLKNEVKGNMKVGAKFTFGPGQVIDVNYQNNSHIGNGTGLHIDESVNGTINWLIIGDTAKEGQTGANVTFRTSGKKEFGKNLWNLNTGVGFKYTTELLSGVTAKFIVNGDVYTGNSLEGFTGKATVNAQADFTFAMLDIIGKNNGKDGWSLGIGASVGATGNITFGGKSDLSFNAGAALRLIGDNKTLDAFKVTIDNISARGNRDPNVTFYVFDFVIKHSITNCTISDNAGAGIVLDGLTQARIDSNTITNNSAGILIEGAATGDIGKNTITGNGKGVIITGTGMGSTINGNSIFNNTTLGIDLGNDGVTPNHPGGAQNFPVLSSATSVGGNTIITGTLNTTPNTTSRLEFFSNDACHPSGFGEGKTFLGFAQVTTDASGNANFSVTLTGVTVPNGSVITSTATNGPNNTSEFSACLQAGGGGAPKLADLQITKAVDAAQLSVGKKVTYTIRVLNKGPEKATGISVTDILPAGITFSQATASAGSYDNTTGKWTIPLLNPADQAVLTLVGTTTKTGNFTNTATITVSDQEDPDKTNNTSSISITVTDTTQVADLQILKTVDAAQLSVGKKVTYTIRVLNKGPEKATGISVTDILPAGITFSQATASAGSYDNTTGKWTIPLLNPADQAVLTLVGTTTKTGNFTNTATIAASDQEDPDKTNNTSSISITVTDTTQVVSVQDQLKQLYFKVNDLVAARQLSRGGGRILTFLLRFAYDQYGKDNKEVSVLALRIFIAVAEALIDRGLLSEVKGRELISAAEKIIEQIESTLRKPQNRQESAGNEKAARERDAQNIRLYANYPNPFSTYTTISFEIPKDSKVSLIVFDQSGRMINPLLNKVVSAGVHKVTWQPQNLPSGIYNVQLRVGNVIKTGRMVYIK